MPNPKTFLDAQNAVGIAVTQDGLLYTTWYGKPAIFKVTDTKQVSAFAPTFPTALAANEKDIDVNPGLGPWSEKYRFVYVTQSPDVFEITPDGCMVKHFIKMDIPEEEWLCITFDRVGTFDFDMIVISLRGKVWRVNSVGNVKQIADLQPTIGGLDAGGAAVVPTALGPNGGQLWVATHGGVWSILPNGGTPTQIATISNAENIAVIPTALTELGSSGGSYFTADYPSRIVEYPASDFIGHAGNVLVGKEDNGSLMEISYTGGPTYISTEFQQNATRTTAEAAAFCQTLPHLLVYTIKFVCGCFEPREREEGPVEPGCYTTAINIHNPNYCNVIFSKRAVLLFDGSQKGHQGFEIPKPPHAPKRARLEPGWGMEIDCADIREVLLAQSTGACGPKAPAFIKGWVVIQSPEPLDIVAVYTARGLDKHSSVSIETERVLPARSH